MEIQQIIDNYDGLCKTIEEVLETLAIIEGKTETDLKKNHLIINGDATNCLNFYHERRYIRASLGEWHYEYYQTLYTAEISYDILESEELQDNLKDKMNDAIFQRKIDAENKKKVKIQEKIDKLEGELKDLKGDTDE